MVSKDVTELKALEVDRRARLPLLSLSESLLSPLAIEPVDDLLLTLPIEPIDDLPKSRLLVEGSNDASPNCSAWIDLLLASPTGLLQRTSLPERLRFELIDEDALAEPSQGHCLSNSNRNKQ